MCAVYNNNNYYLRFRGKRVSGCGLCVSATAPDLCPRPDIGIRFTRRTAYASRFQLRRLILPRTARAHVACQFPIIITNHDNNNNITYTILLLTCAVPRASGVVNFFANLILLFALSGYGIRAPRRFRKTRPNRLLKSRAHIG